MSIVLGNILPGQVFRKCDSAGCGYFGAPRKRKNKKTGKIESIKNAHHGVDIVTFAGSPLFSPITGTVVKLGQAYGDDHRFKTIHIQGQGDWENVKVIIMYATSIIPLGYVVYRGQLVGNAQDLSIKYKSITNHIHVEVYYGGVLQDPTNLFNGNTELAVEEQQQDEVSASEVENDDSIDAQECRLYISTYDTPSIAELRKTSDFIDVIISNDALLQTTVDGKTNHRRLYDNLAIADKRTYNNDDEQYNDQANYPVSIGAHIYIPINAYNFPYTYQSNATVTKTNYAQYFPPIIKRLTTDPGYVRAEDNRGSVYKNIFPQVTVWIWSRSLYLSSPESWGWMNVSKDVISVNTDGDIAGVGGTFTLDIAPINGVSVLTDDGVVHNVPLGRYSEEAALSTSTKPQLYKTFNTNSVGSETIRKKMYYESLLFTNDLVFIAYEKLKIDGDFDITDVANKWYDFQGMIDVVETDVSGEGNEVKITIRGRDFSKAMMEDNSYFNPYSIGHINSLYGGTPGTRFLNGEFQELSTVLARSIQQHTEFILHRIASIGYVPDDIFNSFCNLTEVTTYSNQIKPAKGIWQLIKVFVDDNIRDLRLVDDSISNPNGNILDLISKAAQMPFIEFFADTYGDKYYLILRQPPFTQQAMRDMVSSHVIDEDFSQFEDQTLGSATVGSADYTMNKYLEYSNDYYKRMRTIEQKGLKDKSKNQRLAMIEKTNRNKLSTEIVDVVKTIFPGVVNIEELDVLSDSLRYSNESYAWYKLTDRGNFAGQSVGLGEIQSIYFDDLAQVFGNKLLEVTCNYSDYKFFLSSSTDKDKGSYAEQASQLLTFLIETNIYLPFTRTGSITINRDRRIKKGQWIYYRPTQEYYYVDGVSHNSNISKDKIDATTSIQVSRGMYRRYVEGEFVEDPETKETIYASYFNLVDLADLRNKIFDVVSGTNANDKFDYKSNIGLNKLVLQFFLQKKQSIQNDGEFGI